MKALWQRLGGDRSSSARVDINGKHYGIVSDDTYLEHIGDVFEPQMVRLFGSLVKERDTVLDVGANIGCTAILFGDLAALVHAFEPSSTTFAFLQKNIENSRLPGITAHNYGLGEAAGEFTLTYSADNRSGGFVSNQTRAGDGFVTEAIAIRPLDDSLASLNLPGLDFVKIDVEGFEGSVIRGARRTLAAYRPTVVLELNHWCLNALQRTSVPDFFDLLRSVFPILHAVDDASYLDLHDEGESFVVMYHHILHWRFPTIVAAFDSERLDRFYGRYAHRFVE